MGVQAFAFYSRLFKDLPSNIDVLEQVSACSGFCIQKTTRWASGSKEALVRVVKDPKAKDADRIRAAEAILDRGYGKPVQAVDVDASAVQQVVFVGENEIAD